MTSCNTFGAKAPRMVGFAELIPDKKSPSLSHL